MARTRIGAALATLTVAGMLLRIAGAGPVHPFALATARGD